MQQHIISFFGDLEKRPIERLAILVGGMIFFWILEGFIPLFPMKYKRGKLKHAVVNFGLTLFHLLIHTLLAIFIVKLSDWGRSEGFGLVYWLNSGIWLTVIISVLALDFSSWLVHLIMHKIPVLWRVHLIHHSDTNVDVTTGLRHHPMDSLLRGIFFIIFIFISGAPMYGVMIYQTLVVVSTAFTHANIRLPETLDRILSYGIISPNMHKVHHHYKLPYTDSNYGATFSIWDRMFGTYSIIDKDKLKYGLDAKFPNEKDEDFIFLLMHPFYKREKK